MLYKLEIVDHHRRLQRDKDRLGPVASIHGTPIPVVLTKDDAVEVFSLAIDALFLFSSLIMISLVLGDTTFAIR